MYICIYVYINICIYVYMYICIYVCIIYIYGSTMGQSPMLLVEWSHDPLHLLVNV